MATLTLTKVPRSTVLTLTKSGPTLSLVRHAMSRMDRADIAHVLRDYMLFHRSTVADMARVLDVPRTLIRDLLTDRVTPEPVRHGVYRMMTMTLIAQGEVFVNPWSDDDSSLEGFELIRQYHLDYGTKDVYMSLDNVHGVTIREFELRKGRIYRDMTGFTAI